MLDGRRVSNEILCTRYRYRGMGQIYVNGHPWLICEKDHCRLVTPAGLSRSLLLSEVLRAQSPRSTEPSWSVQGDWTCEIWSSVRGTASWEGRGTLEERLIP